MRYNALVERNARPSRLEGPSKGGRVIPWVIRGLLEDLETEFDSWNSTGTSNTSPEMLHSAENQVSLTENPNLKQGIKLPNSTREWEIANDFFKYKF